MIQKNHKKLLVTICLLISSLPIWALESDRRQPIQIEADQGSLDKQNQTTVFSGNVKMRQGSMYMNAAKITAHKDSAGNQTIIAVGNPATFGQQLEKEGMVYGKGNNVHYESKSGIVTITGNAQVNRGGDMARGAVIVYNTNTEVYTVNSAPLEVNNGEVIGLLGPNGAGKTTSFYMIVGLIATDGGSITLDGEEISHRPIYERARLGLGYLPQEASIFRKMTVAQNINAILEISYPREKRAEQLEMLLADLHIEHLRNNKALSLSGGERRRVEIARVLARNPRFILLDEPFAGVDPIALIDIQNLISFLKQRGIGTLITDHNVRETLRICDRAYIINQGSVLAAGIPEDLVNNEEVRAVYLGEHFEY